VLQIYEALEVVEIINENVGHTKPWVVLANTPEGLKKFVVKLYSSAQVDQFHCVSKEIACNILAGEFDLKVPMCALIEIPDRLSFRLSLADQVQFGSADQRLKFATQVLDNVNIAIHDLPKMYFQKRISIDTLYAFDNLIRNWDRGHYKTNLLLGTKDAFLIDHELTFSITDIVNINLNTLQLEDKFTKYHLFYPYLKKAKWKNKQSFFDEFTFYLNSLNINKLTPYFRQLVSEGFPDYSQPICNWLNQVKQNGIIFVNHIKGSL